VTKCKTVEHFRYPRILWGSYTGLYSQWFFPWACTQAASQYRGFTFPYCTTHYWAAVASVIRNIFRMRGLQ